jgi:uncharacterized RDD family membrane protein YckC
MEAGTAALSSADPMLASPARRFWAWVIDAAVLGVLATPIDPILYSRHPTVGFAAALLAPALVIAFVYLVLFDGGARGATPGKRILHLRVTDELTGGPIGYRRAALRRVVYLIGGLAIYLGWLWILIDNRSQAWHDKAAHTIVVRTEQTREAR